MRGILTLLAALVLAAASPLAHGQGTTDGTNDDTLTGPMDGTATAITIEEAVGSMVCWSVTGTGRVGHVAIHWDDVSHQATTANGTGTTGGTAGTGGTTGGGTSGTTGANATNVTFAEYDLGFAYPNNTAELADEGYPLPGRFCANVTANASSGVGATGGGTTGGATGAGAANGTGTTGTNGTATGGTGATGAGSSATNGTGTTGVGTTLYVVAHVMDVSGAPGLLSREIVVTLAGAATGTDGAGTGGTGTGGTGTGGTGANATDDNGTGDGSPEEANPPSNTPGIGVLAAVAVVGLAAVAARRLR